MEDSLALTMEHVLTNDTICRVCLVRGEGMQALFVEELGIIEQIEYCTGIRLLNEPGLPSHICHPCLAHLSISHSFKSTCLSSHHTLHPYAQTLLNTEPVSVKIERDDSTDMDNEGWVKDEGRKKRKLKREKEDRKAKNQKRPQPQSQYICTENNQTMFVNIGNSFPTHSVGTASISSTSSSVHEFRIPGDSVLHEKTPKKRSKKGSADAASWEINKVKKARESGRPYLSQKRLKGVKVGFETRKERKMGPPCSSTLCRKSSKRRCDIIRDKDRKYCFNKFWTELNWTEKKQYIVDLVDVTNCKKVNGESRRTKTIKYSLEVNNECWPVCKKMFLNTLSIGEKTVLGWLEKACEAAMNNRN